MERPRFSRSGLTVLGVVAALGAFGGAAWAGPTEVIHYFSEDDGDGGYPASDLVMDAEGNVYGTTVLGGAVGSGTVFKLTPSGGGWTETVLYSFTGGADGGQPYNGVTLDAQGNLYGTAVVGGSGGSCEDGCGVVYKLTNDGGGWSQSVLYNFTGGDDGSGPGAGLTFDDAGNLYGMTPTGGAFGLGVIYQLKPGPNDTWSFKVVHAFTGGNDGATGSAGRMLLDGNSFYGAATVGGANGKGVVFKLSPARDGKWTLRPLYAFKGQPDGGLPYGALVRDAAGRLYGTTYYDGANGLGAVYQLTPGPNGDWKEKVIYSFKGGTDGSNPISHLVQAQSGDFYGTTSEGGSPGCNCGTIFKLSATDGRWTETVAYSFRGMADGGYAYNGMVTDGAGTFYGTTVRGGIDDDGVVFRFIP